jgi:hypothetical protein
MKKILILVSYFKLKFIYIALDMYISLDMPLICITYSNYLKFPHSWEKLMGKQVFWKFVKNQVFVGRKWFMDREFLDLRFITYILEGIFRSLEGPFKIGSKSFRTVERASSKCYYFGFYLRYGK